MKCGFLQLKQLLTSNKSIACNLEGVEHPAISAKDNKTSNKSFLNISCLQSSVVEIDALIHFKDLLVQQCCKSNLMLFQNLVTFLIKMFISSKLFV